jgi:DNA polymerase-3 subunit alpha
MPEVSQKFSHLHTHTQYSILDGMNKIPKLVDQAAKSGIGGFAVTDHGNLFALPEVLREQKAANDRGVKIAMGCEFYVTDDRLQKNKETDTYHLTAIAKDNVGLESLMKLSTRAYTEGFYGHPRIDLDLLSEHKDGLIVLSGCLGGQVAQALKDGNKAKAMDLVGAYHDIFGDNYFLEVMPLEIREQIDVNAAISEISKRTGIETITTCDCHYQKKEHYAAHDTWLAIQTGSLLSDPDRFRFSTDRAYFQTPEEVLENSKGAGLDESSMLRTSMIMERISGYEIDKALKMPVIENAHEKLREMAFSGLQKKGLLNRPDYRERLEYELDVIGKLGFDSYFLLVQKIIQIAKNNGTPTGPGRGSAAGSLVVWVLGITDLDPIKHGLIFERFLNPARVSPPDIDLDIGTKGRGGVIRSIVEEYGTARVATIMTLGLALDKMVLKDVMRTEGISFAEANVATTGMKTLDDFSPATPTEHEVLERAKVLNGTVRNIGTHAAGIVISPEPLYGKVPLMSSKVAEENGILQLQLDMKAVDEWGYIKVDVLGLKELDILKDLSKRTGADPKQEEFMHDKDTLDMICVGETTGVFQLGTSEGMKRMLRDMKCDSFNDVCAALSLFRPGPLESGIVAQYIRNKELSKNGEPIPSLNPRTDTLLAETYGVPIYQEQIMEMGKILAGFDMKEADLLRKAMGKKKPEEMAKMKEKWVSGCLKNGISEKEALELFEKVEHFSGYGFNKSHSAAYAITSMKMAWYKCHYPAHYWAAKISHENDVESRGVMAESAKREGIVVVPPRICVEENTLFKKHTGNNQETSHYPDLCAVIDHNGEDRIVLGIETLKGVSEGVAEALSIETNLEGPFKSMQDVYDRLVVKREDRPPILNKRSMVALTAVGFFDPIYKDRKAILSWIESKYKEPGSIPCLEPPKRKRTKKQAEIFTSQEEKKVVQQERIAETTSPKKKNVTIETDKLNSEVACAGTVLSGSKTEIERVVRDHFSRNAAGNDFCSSQSALRQNIQYKKKSSVLLGTLKETRLLVSKKTGTPFYMSQLVLPEDAYPVTLFIWEDQWPMLEKAFKENEGKIVAISGRLSDKKQGWNYSLAVSEISVPEKQLEHEGR